MIKGKRVGRPKGSGDHDLLVHARISHDLKKGLDRIRKKRMDHPTQSYLIREAIRKLVESEG